jgi:hypothetical protein
MSEKIARGKYPICSVVRNFLTNWFSTGWFHEDGSPNKQVLVYKTIQQGSSGYIVAAFDPSIAGELLLI